jgi:hypothetical protein
MKQIRIYHLILLACALAFGNAGATTEAEAPAGYDIGMPTWKLVPFHLGMDKEQFRQNVTGNPRTMSGVEYSQGKYEGTDDTATYDERLQSYHDENPDGHKSLHEHLEALRGPAYSPGTVEAAKPLHDFLVAATGSRTFTYTPERTEMRADGWIGANAPWREGVAGAYPRAFLLTKDNAIQGMFSFALDLPKPEEERPALVHVFSLLNPEYARQSVMKHAVGTVIRTFGGFVHTVLGDHLETAVVRITHQNNAATAHMAQKLAGDTTSWKDIEAFGSLRKQADILFSSIYGIAQTWGLGAGSGTASAE